MDSSTGPFEESPDDYLQRLAILWEEYKYRHDLCWKVLFQLTSAIVVLAIVPYIYRDIVERLQSWILLVPMLAIVLVIFGTVVMTNEMDALQRVRSEYRRLQREKLFTMEHREGILEFRGLVYFYFGVLGLLSTTNLFFVFQLTQH
jgi:hypothetical protein